LLIVSYMTRYNMQLWRNIACSMHAWETYPASSLLKISELLMKRAWDASAASLRSIEASSGSFPYSSIHCALWYILIAACRHVDNIVGE
jgi:hypothetical protein